MIINQVQKFENIVHHTVRDQNDECLLDAWVNEAMQILAIEIFKISLTYMGSIIVSYAKILL